MSSPKPQELTVQIDEQLRLFALSGGSHAAVNMHKQVILRECEKLATVNALDASLLRSTLFALIGDRKMSDYWLKNAERLGARGAAHRCRFVNLVIMGYISEAYPLFDEVVDQHAAVKESINHAVSCGWFRKAQALVKRSQQLNVDQALLKIISQASEFIEKLKLSDEVICQIMDVTYGLMRESELIWLDQYPQIQFLPEEAGGPLICMTYRIDVSPDEAARLSGMLVERLVQADLDAAGLMVALQGARVKSPNVTELVV